MSGIIEFFKYAYVIELAGIDGGEKCLGPGTWHGTKGGIWDVGCDYGVTLGKSASGFSKAAKTGVWREDPCVVFCGIWKRVKRIIGKFKVKGKHDYHTPTAILGVRGTTFTIDVGDDGTAMLAVLEGEVEIVSKTNRQYDIIVGKGLQTVIAPQKPPVAPYIADKNILEELAKWKESLINEENIEELELHENTHIELSKGRLNYTSSASEKGG